MPSPTHAFYLVLRAAFRRVPMGEGMRDRLRSWFLRRNASWIPLPPKGRTVERAAPRRPYVRSDTASVGHTPYRRTPLPEPMPATLVAFYLPQFHAIAENDAWWGKGFTEWRNVTRALPQFEGHCQPRLPGDLGFYDLGEGSGTLREQARLAREYGIGAFCFYFYWFAGKTLLECPLERWRDDRTIDLPYCLCWANENWARRWDGRDDDLLIEQQHGAEDDEAFIAHVAPYLRDERYLRVDGKPVLLVYRPLLMPDPAATASRWRQWCHDNGIGDIHLAYVQSFERPDPAEIGFDAAVEFPPNMSSPASIAARQRLINPEFRGEVLDWRSLALQAASRPLPDYPLYPGVNPGWDNEPRRPGKGRIYLHASPRGYGDWLSATLHGRLAHLAPRQRMVFINAWNEWAEGAVLEPDRRLGHAWLEQTRKALQPRTVHSSPRVAAIVHAWYLDILPGIAKRLEACAMPRVVVTTAPHLADRVRAIMAGHALEWEIRLHENRGRDVLPFLHEADRLYEEGIDIVLKLHTKKTTHRTDGEQWANDLLDGLIPGHGLDTVTGVFATNRNLGILAPEGHLLPVHEYVGANSDVLDYLSVRLGVEPPGKDAIFPAGSMFWARLEALRPLLDAHLSPEEFEPEHGQIDGTLAHGIERFIGGIAAAAGFESSDMEGMPPRGIEGRPYRYARRSP